MKLFGSIFIATLVLIGLSKETSAQMEIGVIAPDITDASAGVTAGEYFFGKDFLIQLNHVANNAFENNGGDLEKKTETKQEKDEVVMPIGAVKKIFKLISQIPLKNEM